MVRRENDMPFKGLIVAIPMKAIPDFHGGITAQNNFCRLSTNRDRPLDHEAGRIGRVFRLALGGYRNVRFILSRGEKPPVDPVVEIFERKVACGQNAQPIAVFVPGRCSLEFLSAGDFVKNRLRTIRRIIGISGVGAAPDLIHENFYIALVRIDVAGARIAKMENFTEAAEVVFVRVGQNK